VPIFANDVPGCTNAGKARMAETGARRIAGYLTKICGKVVPLSRFCGRFIQSPTGSWGNFKPQWVQIYILECCFCADLRRTARRGVVPRAGVEPARPKAADFKSATSTSSVTGAVISCAESLASCGRSVPSSGAGDEIRTRDPNLGKVVLYQLSYSRFVCHNCNALWQPDTLANQTEARILHVGGVDVNNRL
jgi:hypothetical protein